MKKRIFAALLVAVLALIGFIAWRHQAEVVALRAQAERHQAEVAVRRTQAQAHLDALTKQQTHITDLEAKYVELNGSYRAAENGAIIAGQKRKKSGADVTIGKEQIEKEMDGVNVMHGILNTKLSSLGEISDAYADALGEGAVAAFRDSMNEFVQTEGLSLNRWYRASNDINGEMISGSGESEDVQKNYNESDDYDVHAKVQAANLARQWKELKRELQGRIDGAERDLAAIR